MALRLPVEIPDVPRLTKTRRVECLHEFGALGAISGDYCIHCGAKLNDSKEEVNIKDSRA